MNQTWKQITWRQVAKDKPSRSVVLLMALLATVLMICISALLLLAVPALAEAEAPPIVEAHLIDLTPIIQALLTALAGIITIKVMPWIKSRTTVAQREALELATRTLVFAAEQIYKNEKQSGSKKLMYVKARMREKGYDVDIDAIEAAVKELELQSTFGAELALELVAEVEDTPPPAGPDNPAKLNT